MTTPTQAQIDAYAAQSKIGVVAIARIIFENLRDIDGDNADWLYYKEDLENAAEQIIALITAAASPTQAQIDAALKAAAEIGESTESLLSTAIENVNAEIIERCAQVAETHTGGGGAGGISNIRHEIAAAIRALKDK